MNEDSNPEIEPGSEKGLGNLLKTEREKKGLSISQVAGITRLRKHFIEALENEDWEKLPAKVFVKGFIRSYALSIDLDVKEAIRLFEISAPKEEEENFSKALITAEKNKSRIIYLLIPLLVLTGLIFYFTFWWDWNRSKDTEPVTSPSYIDSGSETTATSVPLEKPDPVTNEYPVNRGVYQNSDAAEAELFNPPLEEKEGDSSQENIIPDDNEEVIQETTPLEKEAEDIQTSPPDLVTGEEVSGKDLRMDASGMVLTGIVNMRTYIKIFVDDNPPKEYIFQPGSRPQWSGERGFYVVVGNAAGVEFDFNGEMHSNLGRSGRVKNLRFPPEFRSELED